VAGARLAVWSHGVPHPSEGASTVLFWHYISGLRAAGFDVLSVVLAEPGNGPPERLGEYEALARADGIEVAILRAESFLEERRYAVRLREDAVAPARAAAASFRPHASFCLDFLASWAARGTPAPRAVWLGDLRFQTAWYHALYAARERRAAALQLPLAFVRSLAWRRAYKQALGTAAAVIVSSKSSEARLARIGISSEYQPYPWPAEGGEAAAQPLPEKPTFLFLGNLAALGSRSAFHFMLGELHGELVRRWGRGGFRIVIAGPGGVPHWAVDALARAPELEHVGFVEDLTALLRSVHGAIAPISVPIGNRSRILTALAAGTVVVAHENAALGNPDLVDGETCFLAADAATFAARMAVCVESPAEARGVAERGRELYRSRFRPDVAVAAAVDTLAALLPPAATPTG
jgi:glycosyltransferase involved in cell wall biosynthesis